VSIANDEILNDINKGKQETDLLIQDDNSSYRILYEIPNIEDNT